MVNTLIESEDEATVMATHQAEAGPSGTRMGKTYFNDYTKVEPNKSAEVPGGLQNRRSFIFKIIQRRMRQRAHLFDLTQ